MYDFQRCRRPFSWPGVRVVQFMGQLPACRIPISPDRILPVQGYLAHKETPTPLRPPLDPRQRLTVGS